SIFTLVHNFHKILEQVMRIVRAGRSLRVILNTKHRQVSVTHALERVVVQVDMGQLDLALRQAVWIDSEIVVMRGDLDPAAMKLLDRMISAVVTELELVGFAAQREAE